MPNTPHRAADRPPPAGHCHGAQGTDVPAAAQGSSPTAPATPGAPALGTGCRRRARALRTAVLAHQDASYSEDPTVKVAGSSCTGHIEGSSQAAAPCCRHHALLCLRLFPHGLTAEQASLNVWGIQGGYAELVATAQTPTDLPGRAHDHLEVQ